MRNKKGLVKIIEAFIAIMLIVAVLSFIYVQKVHKPNQREEVIQLERIILNKIQADPQLREAVLVNDEEGNEKINSTINQFMPAEYMYTYRICEINQICSLERASSYYTENEIVSEEVSISSTLQIYSPKKIKIFVWEKE